MLNTILLTGASGFLGKNIRKQLLQENISHFAISLKGDESAHITALDLGYLLDVKKFVSEHEFSVVFHVGAFVNLSRDYQTASRCISDNLLGTLNLLEACRGKKHLKFIFSSTEEIYGDNQIPYEETQLPEPPSPYSISKIAAENFISYYSAQYGYDAVLLRIGTMYGPHMPKNKFISQIVGQIIAGKPVLLNAGKKKRDYIYVDDVVAAFMLAASEQLSDKTCTLNIGSGTSTYLDDFVNKIIFLAGSSSVIKYGAINERSDESANWLMDISKAKRLLGWKPRHSIEAGIQQLLDNYHK